jgi:predicted nucleic acid-binding protein
VSAVTAPIGAVLLDSGPLSLATQRPGQSAEGDSVQGWIRDLLRSGIPVYVPEIADYELRRKLLHLGHAASVARLDRFNAAWPARYVPITTAIMRLAADLWAQARRTGQSMAPPDALDGDVILAAQAITLAVPGLVVATSNPGHLSRFVTAEVWRNILP